MCEIKRTPHLRYAKDGHKPKNPPARRSTIVGADVVPDIDSSGYPELPAPTSDKAEQKLPEARPCGVALHEPTSRHHCIPCTQAVVNPTDTYEPQLRELQMSFTAIATAVHEPPL